MKDLLRSLISNIKSLLKIISAILLWIFILCAVSFAVQAVWMLIEALIKAIFN